MKTHGNNKFRACLYALFFFVFTFAGTVDMFAQMNVSGTVRDSKGQLLEGVAVIIDNDGNKIGTMTDAEGHYSISAKEGDMIEFSSIGYVTMKIAVGRSNVIDVALDDDNILLEEAVAIGYGTVKKKDILGSVSTVKESALETRTNGGVIESMRGLTSGIKITSSGQPGSNASMVIRGLGSLTNNSPLFIIDGAYGGSELGLNVEDIESIQVLKDASSAAIYGSRAANGVVIITTKKGKGGALKVKFDASAQMSWLPRYDLMDAETYKIYNDRAYQEAMLANVASVTSLQNHYEGNTDWQEEMLGTGILQNYNVSLSGGNEALNYYASINRLDDKGALNYTGYDKWGFRINTSGKKGIFSYGENFFFTKSNTEHLNGAGNVWSNFIAMPPTIPVYDESHPGGFGYGDVNRANSYGLNPVAMQELYDAKNKENYLYGNIYGQINLINMFEVKLNVAYKNYMGTTDSLRKKGNWTMGQGDDAANVGYQSAQHDNILIEPTFRFYHVFGKHDINLILGGSWNKFHEETRWITKLNPLTVGSDYITSLNAATGTTTAGGAYSENAMVSFFGRLNYSYADRYLLQLTARRDGTSRLPAATRWGNFYSASLGWRISAEPFFDVPWINDLKLRANYGTLGNSSIGNWDYQAMINTAPRAILGGSDNVLIGMTQSNIVNNDLRWEEKTTANVGVDFLAFDSRFSAAVEWFYSRSKDLLVYLPIPSTSGNEGGSPATNAGSLSNTGFEIELGWNDRIGDFSYSAGLNLSHVKNKILDLGYGQTVHYTSLSKSEIGQPLGMWYLYEMAGIFQSQDEIDTYVNKDGKVIQPNALPGDIKYVDWNGDGQISSEDRHIIDSPWPKLEMGLNISLAYKGWDMNISGYGRFGQTIYNGSAAAAADMTDNQNLFNGYKPWTQEDPTTDTPRLLRGDSRNSRGDQDRWLEDGSFFRFSDISLGYSIPTKAIKKIGLEQFRISVVGKNLVTFTKYRGLDPEFADGGIYTIGHDGCSHPNPRSVQLALSFTF